MKKILTIISITITYSLIGQNFNINIIWKNINKKPYFTDCYYFDTLPSTPFYFKKIKLLNKANSATVSINNISTIKSTKYDYLINSKTPTKIKYSYKIATIRKQTYLLLWINAGININNTYNLLTSANVNVSIKHQQSKQLINTRKYKEQSLLSNGYWRKVSVANSGVYKITYSELTAMGFSNLDNLRMFGFGGKQLSYRVNYSELDGLPEVPILVNKGSDGVFNSGDYILFYGQGVINRHPNSQFTNIVEQKHDYANSGHYFLTTSLGVGKRIETTNYTNTTSKTITSFLDIKSYFFESQNLNQTGRIFFSDPLSVNEEQTFNFSFPNLITSNKILIASYVGAISSGSGSIFYAIKNNEVLGQVYVNRSSTYFKGIGASFSTSGYAQSDDFSLNMKFQSNNAGAQGYISYISVSAERQLKFNNEQLIFQHPAPSSSNYFKYIIQKDNSTNIKVLNISEINNVKEVTNSSTSSNSFEFTYPSDGTNLFIAFDNSSYLSVTDNGTVENQNLKNTGDVDLIIVTHPNFINQANQLAEFHRTHDNLKVLVVEPQTIYNEFSSGNTDVSGIRNFMIYKYNSASNINNAPKNLLLFGDGSYDNKSTTNNTNYIPTFETKKVANANSVACDDFFVMLDEGEGGDENSLPLNGFLDMGIGRLPANSIYQAQTLVDKTINYVANPNLGAWKNEMCFLGDDPQTGDYFLQVDAYELATLVRDKYPWINVKIILMDAYQQESTPLGEKYPAVTRAINENIHRGISVFNYTGHGSETHLAHENVLNKADVDQWTNTKLPFFMTGSCEVSRFDNKNEESLGENILLHPNGGAIALLSTTRVVYGSNNQQLSLNFYNHIFETNDNGRNKTLGEIIAQTKNLTNDTNSRNFMLFGDPAVELDVPSKRAVTDSINDISVHTYIDTLKALKKIKITGHITDSIGNMCPTFNGKIFPIVYDKLKKKETLNNDNNVNGTFTYYEQNNIIYRGQSTVKNGIFTFEFIVPIDINYEVGRGKISYYAENGVDDAYGYFDSIKVGGSESGNITDKTGPEIAIYLNDTTFSAGGTTNESPLLIIKLNDDYGINTTGNSVGHDLCATLNNDYSNKIILNDFYENDINTYKSGKITYQLLDLDEGENTLEIKAWDVLNNPSTSFLEFTVANSDKVVLKHLLNYPNPFTTKTKFLFEHNQSAEIINVRIQIFTISGKLIKTLETTVAGTQYMNNPIVWNGKDDYGDNIGKGVYIYKVRLSTTQGKVGEKFEKLLILK